MHIDVNDLYSAYNILPLYIRRNQQLLSMMHKYSHRPKMLCTADPGTIITRSSNKVKFEVKFTSITRVQRSPLNRGVTLWNMLPGSVQKLDLK